MHDIAKPATKRFEPGHGWTFHGHEDRGARMVPKLFTQLKLPLNEKMKFVQKMVQLHMRPIVLAQSIVTDSAVRRLLFDAGDDIDQTAALVQGRHYHEKRIQGKTVQAKFLTWYSKKIKDVEERDNLRNWQPPVSGKRHNAAIWHR